MITAVITMQYRIVDFVDENILKKSGMTLGDMVCEAIDNNVNEVAGMCEDDPTILTIEREGQEMLPEYIRELEEELSIALEAIRWIPVGITAGIVPWNYYLVYYGEDQAYGSERALVSKLGGYFSERATHWMPLPEAPEEDAGGEE